MRYTGKQIVMRIKSHVRRRGGTFADWFIGVSAAPRSMLFEKHRVHKKGDYWILARATSSVVAQKVKSFFARKLGMAMETQLEDAADFVYAYKKAAHTAPYERSDAKLA